MKKRRLLKLIAVIISTALNPFFVLPLSFLGANWNFILSEPHQTLIFFVVNATLPTVFYLYLIVSQKKSIFHFPNLSRKDRYVIFLSAIFSTLVSTILFKFTGQNMFWVYSSMVLCVLFAAYYMINRYIDKISLHAGVFAFSMIYLTDKSNTVFAAFLAALPIIYWARIKLHQHTWFQLILGTVIGMFIGILTWTF